MHNATALYCIGCEKMIDLKYAHVVFKTGFYKIKYPLAICMNCSAEQVPPYALQACDETAAALETWPS